ncbi:MAG: aldo/keto reductase [Phycisphaerae bacterium]|nr:aldo/keto reductase [Phycisphaerae bacterium]
MSKFAIAKNGVEPDAVPKKILYTGAEIPAIGLGTFGSDRFTHAQVADAVRDAISVGYRHIDCASVYGNENEIGKVLAEVIDAGVPRQELWITSKVWNDMHGPGDILCACARSLKDLQLDYLDLYLVHWPFPNFHSPGCDVNSRSPDAKPYIHEEFMKTWRQMERLVEAGLVRHIGTSNMTVAKMKLLLRDARIKPVCNEMELHPHFQQLELFQYCIDNQIQPIGFCPIGSPTRPDRDKTGDDTVDIEDPVVLKIAERLGVHAAVVCLKWAFKRGQIPIPFSVHHNEYLSNLIAATKDHLTDAEMAELDKIDKNCRLIKGQVFLWKDNQRWEDLWDINGEITPE